MTKYYWILLILPALACGGMGTPLPPTPTPAPDQPTIIPTSVDSPTPAPTTIPETDTPPSVTTFPDPNNYTWQVVTFGLERPVELQADGSGRLFVIEKLGHIHIIENGQLIDTPFLNIEDRVNNRSNEMGLLGLAFHPNYAQNGYFFVNYTGAGGDTFISRFQVTNDANLADPSSEVNLLHIEQPFPNHNGGGLDFGPDGYLYAGMGDGGSAGDPFGNGQNLDTLLGKILRLDVDSADPYAVPSDNPFGNEIWAYGLRNPWRITFDSQTGDLYIGDVGQNQWEEIDIIPANSPGGLNFGWDYFEGNHEYDLPSNASGDFISPIAEYSHGEGGCSVTGGYVYRGSMPEWNGIYLYGDYCTGFIWGLINVNGAWQTQRLFDTDVNITSFGQDQNGEIYLVADVGYVYQLVQR
jgi:glucose/arabinose dehydrogenase